MYTSIGSQRFAECVVSTMLANGSYRKLVQRLRQRLTRQMAATLRVLGDNGWEVFAEPVGGMFVWARIGDYPFAELQAVATRLDVLLSPGSGFSRKARRATGCVSTSPMPATRGPWRSSRRSGEARSCPPLPHW
ncbi:transcriptional regulator [Pseudomonas aeruginosa]|nr:transcriptional regulator [Pseudomonas aeruginosa]